MSAAPEFPALRRYLETHPVLRAVDVAAAVGVSRSFVYIETQRHHLNKQGRRFDADDVLRWALTCVKNGCRESGEEARP